MINLNAKISPVSPQISPDAIGITKDKPAGIQSGFADTVKVAEEKISKVDYLQQASDISIQDLLSGKNEDISTVVSAVAKADMSFKLLVGVRNKLIDAYKQTMNMPI
jgi:flagellar hook-basal body complex protein FliE